MSYQTPSDRDYFNQKSDYEFRQQGIMDSWYVRYGFEIMNRDGNKKRDLIVRRDGRTYQVEEKYREKDYGDFLIEIIQDLVTNDPGWFYTEKPDRLSYIITDNNIPVLVYWVDFRNFKDWLFGYLKINKFPKTVISPLGYGLTMNIAIKWNDIDPSLYRKFAIDAYGRNS